MGRVMIPRRSGLADQSAAVLGQRRCLLMGPSKLTDERARMRLTTHRAAAANTQAAIAAWMSLLGNAVEAPGVFCMEYVGWGFSVVCINSRLAPCCQDGNYTDWVQPECGAFMTVVPRTFRFHGPRGRESTPHDRRANGPNLADLCGAQREARKGWVESGSTRQRPACCCLIHEVGSVVLRWSDHTIPCDKRRGGLLTPGGSQIII
jgi:hypothetical protein